jgi:hypothetical protein
MSSFALQTAALNGIPFYAANVAPSSSVAQQVATTTDLTNAKYATAHGLMCSGGGNRTQQNFGKFIFWGTGSATNTFEAKIVAWTQIGVGQSALWVPWQTLIDLTCTLGTAVGVNGTPITASMKFVGTLAVISSMVDVNYTIPPADNGIQILKIDLAGYQVIQLLLGNSGTPASDANGALAGF